MREVETTVEPDVLRDRVFIVLLIRVLTDGFGSAKDLYHRLKQKSSSDDEQNEPRDTEHDSTRDRRDSHSNIIEALGRHVRWSLDRRATHHSDSEDDLVCNASVQVQAIYDRAYRKLGEPYARGDDFVRIQLQSHIIKLQQVLISIHQDLMLSNYLTISSSHSQLIHLVQTVRTTRAAAIQALDMLYQRMLATSPKKSDAHPPMPGGFPLPPRSLQRSRSSSPCSSDTSVQIPSNPIPKPNPNINKLFCRYALDLQFNIHLPLSANFKLDGNRRCPRCRIHIPVQPNKAWEVVMETSRRHPRCKKFLVRNVFVVKCHREGGGFACVLCAQYGGADTVCRSIEALMEHLWKEHTSEDLERDGDIVGC
ncbi:hypothetical protein BU25DRAFT_382061 [Macroventuria anomochaeta]|uniref:Uncharacterized protein n=1 Tax=Macroventuria anomochaeta TaxID=301207 RepID=A0ACB6SES5_9PLEO|nr:uncharacterized protein BU25DRAFT_382061 [Macroventuria anomochaeta]KAF2632539.1 hypothetical protein BU25DRAFT_382061 [Macroventuria anomochaeta]